MEDSRAWLDDAFQGDAHSKQETFAANARYCAYLDGRDIHVDQLGSNHRIQIAYQHDRSGHYLRLAFSNVQPSLLAIVSGTTVAIHDVAAKSARPNVICADRAITALAWSNSDAERLATGQIDGRVAIWSLAHTGGPSHIVAAGQGACHCLAWSFVGEPLLAAGIGNGLHIWHVGTAPRRLDGCRRHAAAVQHIAWPPVSSYLIAIGDGSPTLTVWDIKTQVQGLIHTADEDEDLFGRLDDAEIECDSIHLANLASHPDHLSWLGDHGLLAIVGQTKRLQVFEMHNGSIPMGTIWEASVQFEVRYVAAYHAQTTESLLCLGPGISEFVALPMSVIQHLSIETHVEQDGAGGTVARQADAPTVGSAHDYRRGMVQPISISLLRAQQSDFSRTSRQIQQRRRTSSKDSARSTSIGRIQPETDAHSLQPPIMEASLEPQKKILDEDQSPMSFLSPTIPSRKASSSAAPYLDGHLSLPPPPQDSFDSLPSTAAPDSDSDDETFDGTTMLGSGNLMLPGGVNVPLPKSCGALFAPNGQLVTYFPPKPSSSAKSEDFVLDDEKRSSKAAKMFPTFGNLGHGVFSLNQDSDSESVTSAEGIAYTGMLPSELSTTSEALEWQSSFSPQTPPFQSVERQRSVNVNVRDVRTYTGLDESLAMRYELYCRPDSSGQRSAQYNAEVTSKAGLALLPNLWHLIAFVLAKRDPLQQHDTVAHPDCTGIHPRVPTSSHTEMKAMDCRLLTASSSQLTVTEQTFGESWLAAQVFAMAEASADLQTLGCISALLLSFEAHAKRSQLSAVGNKLSHHDDNYFVQQQHHRLIPKSIPILRNDSKESDFVQLSPTKYRHTSHASSRNPSQPTTPRPDSLSSTPPFPFPSLSRQGSRTSSSASPETHRSSFSAAAKYYAQSITEKISAYGTSPPTKKFGSSPGNDSSSSLPYGSWGKSVSFASTTDIAQDGHRSRTLMSYDDGYDSDRTIEDSSLPHTPRSGTGEIVFTMEAETEWSEQSRIVDEGLLSPMLLAKAKLWVRSYAEQLRTWSMDITATELENLAGPEADAPTHLRDEGVLPLPFPSQRKPACSICYARIEGLQQACPRCLHTVHLSCLAGLLENSGLEGFECPAGCGCNCAGVPYEEVVWEKENTVRTANSTIRKLSLTDPRVWRARVEGASW